MAVRQFENYLGLKNLTCTLLLEHQTNDPPLLHAQDTRRFELGRGTER